MYKEMTKEELQNYEPKGQLEGFPKEIIKRMLDCQEEQGNKRDVTVFERWVTSRTFGFDWRDTKEKFIFWVQVISNKDFNLFFEKYPKQDNQEKNQKFKVGDKVIDIITRGRGEVISIDTLNKYNFPIYVYFNTKEKESFTLDGRFCNDDKQPRLLHYRDDYDYSIIDFNNLPKRQEPKRWRAKKGEYYYAITTPSFKIGNYFDVYIDSDNENFETGNYFQNKEKAQEVADKLKEYFKQLIKEEHEQ